MMPDCNIVVIHKQNDFVRRLKSSVLNTMIIVEKRSVRMLIQEARLHPVSCVILHIEQDIPEKVIFERFKLLFPCIPCLAVVTSPNMELARSCGTIGIDCILFDKELHLIGDEIIRICAEKNNTISLLEVGIDKTDKNYSLMLKDALVFMEKNYRKILNTNEISDWMEVSECTLSREFAKSGLPGPKKILMLLKVRQAIRLMHNKGLSVREISSLSGFTDEKRMAECFHRMFGMPPGEYRQRKVTSRIINK